MKRPAAAPANAAPSPVAKRAVVAAHIAPSPVGKRAKLSGTVPVEATNAISVDDVVTPARTGKRQDVSAKRKADNSASNKRKEEAVAKQKAEAAAAAQKKEDHRRAEAARKEEERKIELARLAAQRELELKLARSMAEKAIELARKEAAEGVIEAKRHAEDEDAARKASETASAASKEAEESAADAMQKAREAESAAKKLSEEAAEARKKADELEVAAAAARKTADEDGEKAKKQAALALSAKNSSDQETLKLKTQQRERREAEERRKAADSKITFKLKDFCNSFNLQLTSNDNLVDALEKYLASVPGTEAFKRKVEEEERVRKQAEEAALIAKREAEQEAARAHLCEQEDIARKQCANAAVPTAKLEERKEVSQEVSATKAPAAELISEIEAKRKEDTVDDSARIVIQKQSEIDDVSTRKYEDKSLMKLANSEVVLQAERQSPVQTNKVPRVEDSAPSKVVNVAANDELVDMPLYEISNPLGAPIRSGTPDDLSSGKAKYEGRLKQGARIELLDSSRHKSEFGIEHALVRVLCEHSGPQVRIPVFVNMREIALVNKPREIATPQAGTAILIAARETERKDVEPKQVEESQRTPTKNQNDADNASNPTPMMEVSQLEGHASCKNLNIAQSEEKSLAYIVSNPLGAPIRSGTPVDLSSGKAKYEGRLKQGARMERLGSVVYKSEFGIEHALVRLVGEECGPRISAPVFVNMREIALVSDPKKDITQDAKDAGSANESQSHNVGKEEQKLIIHSQAEPQSDTSKEVSSDALSKVGARTYEVTNALGAAIRSGSDKDLQIGFSKYEGRLKTGTKLERVDDNTYKSEFGMEHLLVRVLDEPFRPPVFIGISDVSISAVQQKEAPAAPDVQNSTVATCTEEKATSDNPFENGMCRILLPGSSSSQPTPVKPTAPSRDEQEVSPSSEASSAENPSLKVAEDDGVSFAARALPRQSELVRLLASKHEAFEKKSLEAKAARAEHVDVLARNSSADEAAKPEVARLELSLASAKQAEASCLGEASRIKTLHASFAELVSNPCKKSEQSATSMKPQLKIIGVDKKTVDALPPAIGKKKRSQADKKLINCIEDVLGARIRYQTDRLEKSKGEVQRVEQELSIISEAKQRRANETAGLEVVLKAKESEEKACQDEVSNASRELSEHEARMSREGLLRYSSISQACTICCTEVEAGAAAMLGCNHGYYCFDCVTRFVETRLDNGTAGDVPCPECSAAICEKDLVNLLPRKTVIRLHARSMEMEAVASGALQRSCPTPDCKMRHTLKAGSSGQVTCVMCAKESCLLCGAQPFHTGRTCEQHAKRLRAQGLSKEDESFFKWMEATGTRQCPKCQMATSKENLARQTEQRSECHKMLCRNCGTRFCFKCLAILTETYTCGCTKNKHGFIDPFSGEVVGHLKRGAAKKTASSKG